jgi:prepilin-type N-terminal cleavage/methylation domain-containing protein
MRAFSLIETMIVVAIFGIISALAVPILFVEIHKAQLNGATEGVANFLARARSEAMRSKRCVDVKLNALVTPVRLEAFRVNSFNCDQGPTPGAPFIEPGPGLIVPPLDKYVPDSKNITIAFQFSPTTPGAGIIRFRPTGRVLSNDALANTPVLNNDDGILSVTHSKLTGAGAVRRVLVEGNGLICAFDRGVTVPGVAPNFNCP